MNGAWQRHLPGGAAIAAGLLALASIGWAWMRPGPRLPPTAGGTRGVEATIPEAPAMGSAPVVAGWSESAVPGYALFEGRVPDVDIPIGEADAFAVEEAGLRFVGLVGAPSAWTGVFIRAGSRALIFGEEGGRLAELGLVIVTLRAGEANRTPVAVLKRESDGLVIELPLANPAAAQEEPRA